MSLNCRQQHLRWGLWRRRACLVVSATAVGLSSTSQTLFNCSHFFRIIFFFFFVFFCFFIYSVHIELEPTERKRKNNSSSSSGAAQRSTKIVITMSNILLHFDTEGKTSQKKPKKRKKNWLKRRRKQIKEEPTCRENPPARSKQKTTGLCSASSGRNNGIFRQPVKLVVSGDLLYCSFELYWSSVQWT